MWPAAPTSDAPPPWGTRSLNDRLIVDFLVQATSQPGAPLEWREKSDGGWVATLNGVGLELSMSYSLVYRFIKTYPYLP